jgi:hypothetical protein
MDQMKYVYLHDSISLGYHSKKNVSRCGASNDFVTVGVTVTTLLKFFSIAFVVYSFEVMLCIPSESWSCYFDVCMHSDANYFMVFNA